MTMNSERKLIKKWDKMNDIEVSEEYSRLVFELVLFAQHHGMKYQTIRNIHRQLDMDDVYELKAKSDKN